MAPTVRSLFQRRKSAPLMSEDFDAASHGAAPAQTAAAEPGFRNITKEVRDRKIGSRPIINLNDPQTFNMR
jgi:hypothetical protein